MSGIDFTTRVVMDDPTKPLTDAERTTLVHMATAFAGDEWHPEYADAMVKRFDATVTALTARLTGLETALREIQQLNRDVLQGKRTWGAAAGRISAIAADVLGLASEGQ